ncbi:MAG: AsmA family protein [Chthoniobacter sp.]|nr:AsmA family protein [Chthoniobacter sp.]
MKKVAKAILLGLGVLCVVLVIGSFCLHAHLQSPHTQERIRAQFSHALGMPLKLTNTSFSPWGGLRITGVTIPEGDANFFAADNFSAGVRWLPLLVGKVSIPEITVDRPKLVWKENAKGKWVLPKLTASESTPATEAAPARPEKAPAGKAEKAVAFDIARLRVNGGATELSDNEGKQILACTGVNVTCTTVTESKVEGVVEIGHLVWTESVALDNVRAPFTWSGGELTVTKLTGTLSGGAATGSFKGRPKAENSPFEAEFQCEKVDLAQFTANLGWKVGQATGTAAAQLRVAGDLDRLNRATGPGQFQITDARFKQLDFLQSIGKALDIQELTDLRLKDGHGDFHLADKKIHVDQMALNALNLQLGVKGTVGYDQKVALEAQLGVEDGLLKQLPEMLRDSFGQAEDGHRTIGFQISGTTDKLRTNLFDKLIGQKVGRQFDDLLTGIFRGKDKDSEKRKKDEEERKKDEKRKKKEQEKAAAKAAAAAGGAAPPAAALAPANATPPAGPPTTAITPVKP